MEEKVKQLLKYLKEEEEKAKLEMSKNPRVGKTAQHFYQHGLSVAFSDAQLKVVEIFEV